MIYQDGRFWETLDKLVESSECEIDRPKGTRHPRYTQHVYPLDYGYLRGTRGGDREGIDVWFGSTEAGVVGIVATVDPVKRDAEVKVLLNCTSMEIAAVADFYTGQPQGAIIQLRP